MIKPQMVLVALCAGALAKPAVAADQLIGFSTRDANGMHVVTLISNGGVVIHSGKDPRGRIDRIDPARFQSLWKEIKDLEADGLGMPARGNEARASTVTNYVLLLKNGDVNEAFLVFPKCARNQRVDETMRRLTEGFLPSGSPGISAGACDGQKP